MTAIKKELRELARRASITDFEKLRNDMLTEWSSYCLSADLSDEVRYCGAGIISMAAPENLEAALEFGNGYAVVRNSNYTLFVYGPRTKKA